MVKDWPMNEVKALLGYEVGRLVLKKLPQLVPEAGAQLKPELLNILYIHTCMCMCMCL